MSVNLLNTNSGVNGKTAVIAESPATITGLLSFSRGSNPPFAVNSGATKVTNLEADKLDGEEGADFHNSALLVLTDVTTNDVSITKHGFVPKAPNDATKVLTGLGTWAVPQSCRVTASAQNITTGTNQALVFDGETFDAAGFHDNVTNNTRMTAPIAGKYLVVGNVSFAADAAGSQRNAKVRVNGTTFYNETRQPPNAGNVSALSVEDVLDLAASDYVEIIVVHDKGSNLSATGMGSMVRIG